MALECQQGIVAVHPLPVVGHADEPPSTRFHLDPDALGARVEGVFQELLHDRCGPVHHLAGSDLVSNLVGKYADPPHKV